jgi:GTP:adenosylcobinamide-phosphate guanylyltransferase
MDALIMAGGMGSVWKIEKPMTLLCGKPMISYILSALLGSKISTGSLLPSLSKSKLSCGSQVL